MDICKKVYFSLPEGEVTWNARYHGMEYRSADDLSVDSIYDKHYFDCGYIDKREQRIPHYKKIVDLICPYDNGGLLDIGAGTGLFLHEAEQKIAPSCGIEPSAAACAFAKTYCSSEIINCDPLDLPRDWGCGAYGIVTVLDVLAHVKEPEALLNRCYGYLKPGGVLVLKTPNHPPEFYDYVRTKYGKNPAMYRVLTHLPYQRFGWGIDGLTEFVRFCGFQVQSAEPFDEHRKSGQFEIIDVFHPRRMLYKHQIRQAEKFLQFPSIFLTARKAE